MFGVVSPARRFARPSFILPVVCAVAAGICAPVVHAEEKYDIWVGNVQVTSANKDNVKGDGTVRYDSDTGVLFLNNATITDVHQAQNRNTDGGQDSSERAIFNVGLYATNKNPSRKPLTLDLRGVNNINITSVERDAFGIKYESLENVPLKLQGNGQLNVTIADSNKSTYGLQSNMPLHIDGPTVRLTPGRSENGASTALSLTLGFTLKSGQLHAIGNYGKDGSAGIVNNFQTSTVAGGKLVATAHLQNGNERVQNIGFRSTGDLTVTGGEATFQGVGSALSVSKYTVGQLPVQVNGKPEAEGARAWDRTTSLRQDGPYKFVSIGTELKNDQRNQEPPVAENPAPPAAEVPEGSQEQDKQKENNPKPDTDTTQPDNGTAPGDRSNENTPAPDNSPRGWVKALLGVLGSLGVLGILAAVLSALIPQHLIPPALRNLLRG